MLMTAMDDRWTILLMIDDGDQQSKWFAVLCPLTSSLANGWLKHWKHTIGTSSKFVMEVSSTVEHTILFRIPINTASTQPCLLAIHIHSHPHRLDNQTFSIVMSVCLPPRFSQTQYLLKCLPPGTFKLLDMIAIKGFNDSCDNTVLFVSSVKGQSLFCRRRHDSVDRNNAAPNGFDD